MIKSKTIYTHSFLVIFLIFFINTLVAQSDIAQLKKTLVTTNNVDTKIELNLELANHYLSNQNDSGLVYTKQVLEFAKNHDDYRELFDKIRRLGFSMTQIGNFKLHRACFEQLKTFSEEIKHDSLIALSLYGIANNQVLTEEFNQALETITKVDKLLEHIDLNHLQLVGIDIFKAGLYNHLQQHEKAIKFYIKALKTTKEHEYVDQQVICLLGLSDLHMELENFDKAIDYTLQGLEIVKTLDKPIWSAVIELQLGNIYITKSNTPEDGQHSQTLAKKHFESAIEKAIAINFPPIEGVAYLNLGVLYFDTKELNKSSEYLQKSIPIAQMTGDQGNELRAYSKLAEVHEQLAINIKDINVSAYKNHLEQAVLYGTKSYDYSKNLGIIDIQVNSSENLAKIYETLDSFEQAYLYSNIHKTLKDSLLSEEKLKIIEETEAQYQTEKSALEIELLNKENAQQATLLYSFIIGSVIILFFLIIVYFLYQQKNKANKTLAEQNELISAQKETLNKQNEEKEILLKEIHHRVKNNLQIISSLLDLQNKGIEDIKASTAIEDGQSRIKSMALIHHKLYQNEDIVSINFKEYTQQLLTQILGMATNISPTQVINIPENIEFDIDTAIPLGLILNELLTNACKYAFTGKATDKIEISLSKISMDNYELKVQDNGIGLPEDFNFRKSRSLGLRLVRRLSKQLFGSADYQNNNGAQFIITFKDTLSRKKIA